MRRCTRCGLLKPVADFAFEDLARGTRQSYCRSCQKAYRRGHYERNRDTYIRREVARLRERRTANRKLLLAYLRSHACVDCGETDVLVLQFDHRDRSNKRRNVAFLVVRRSWATVMKEIEKCDVRCANCHRRRTAAQFRWRKREAGQIGSAPDSGGPLNEGLRRCTGCGELKSLSEFALKDRARGLRRSRCRECMRLYTREHYRRNRSKYASGAWSRTRNDRIALRKELDAYLRAHPCVDCGEGDPLVLEFDHRDGTDKRETVAWFTAKGDRAAMFAEIDKCDVRCANCHHRRTARQFRWTKLPKSAD